MKERLEEIKRLREHVLLEVAQMAWDGNLEQELSLLPEKMQTMIGGIAGDEQLLEEEINLALGLEADNREEYAKKVERAEREKGQTIPIISHIAHLCVNCQAECEASCPEGAIVTVNGKKQIDRKTCSSCGLCLSTCVHSALADKAQFAPLLKLLKYKKNTVYAVVAPAIAGQFGDDVSLGKIRTALKLIGFHEMIEVALFADILTIQEAYTFDDKVKTDEDYLITSCCCPVWIQTIEKKFPTLLDKVVASVSPMIAAGRVLKALDEDALVVFIGPCIAKKREALEPELRGAVDFVLTFKELSVIFSAVKMDFKQIVAEEKEQASWAGKIYGRSGGVSAAISLTLEAIAPKRAIKVRSKRADGVSGCQQILQKIMAGDREINFVEGMGCRGGCIGGPGKMLTDLYEASHNIDDYGEEANVKIPLNNPMVYEILRRLGMNYKTPKMVTCEPLKTLLQRDFER